MIREVTLDDLIRIGEIGELIKADFNKVYDIEKFINYDYAKIFVYEEDGIVRGFIQIEIHFEVVDIINIAVDKDYQNQGIATKLLSYIFETINAESFKLEVNVNNIKAIQTYEKNGFQEIHRRKKYYGEFDAIIMERVVK